MKKKKLGCSAFLHFSRPRDLRDTLNSCVPGGNGESKHLLLMHSFCFKQYHLFYIPRHVHMYTFTVCYTCTRVYLHVVSSYVYFTSCLFIFSQFYLTRVVLFFNFFLSNNMVWNFWTFIWIFKWIKTTVHLLYISWKTGILFNILPFFIFFVIISQTLMTYTIYTCFKMDHQKCPKVCITPNSIYFFDIPSFFQRTRIQVCVRPLVKGSDMLLTR